MSLEWMLIRGSGIVAFGLLAAATIWGLMVSTKVLGRFGKAKVLTWFHESLAVGALLATVVHVAVLSVHDYLEFSWTEILIPGTSDWRRSAVALGVVSLYGLAVITGSFYVKKHIGHGAWRAIHFSSLGVFFAALLHGITAGTDTRAPLLTGLYFGSAMVVAALIAVRITSESTPNSIGRSPDGAREPVI